MVPHDSRRYHRTRPPTFIRAYGSQSSTPVTRSPFGAVPYQLAGRLGRQQINPLLMGLGLGAGPRAQRLQADIMSGRAQGPLASAIRGIQQFAPGVIGGAQGIGQQMSQQGAEAVRGLQQSIAAAQAGMPQYQAAVNQGLAATQGALGSAQDLYGQAAAMLPGLQQTAAQGTQGAQQALNLAQQYTTGPQMTAAQAQLARAQGLLGGGAAEGGAAQALNLAQRYAQQAASPIAGEDLYQMATQRALQTMRPGLAARGLEAGGAGAQAESDVARNLAFQFAQQQAAQRQGTLQGLGAAASGLGNIQSQAQQNVGAAASGLGNLQAQGLQGLQGASQGVQQAAAGQAALGQTMIPYLQAIQQGAQNVGGAAQQGAGMLMTGPQLAGEQANAVNQLGQTLMQQYNLPMQASGNLLNLLTAGVSPGLQMLGATAPVTANQSKGYNII
jgi:hypothetical protein